MMTAQANGFVSELLESTPERLVFSVRAIRSDYDRSERPRRVRVLLEGGLEGGDRPAVRAFIVPGQRVAVAGEVRNLRNAQNVLVADHIELSGQLSTPGGAR
jgi:hypothetical protein